MSTEHVSYALGSGDGVTGSRKFPMLLHCSFSDLSRVEFQTLAVTAGESDHARDSSMVMQPPTEMPGP